MKTFKTFSFYCTFSLIILIIFLNLGFTGYYKAMFPDMVYGKAYKPFVYRTLLPSTTRLISHIVPAEIKNTIVDQVKDNKTLLAPLRKDLDFIFEYLICLILMYFCLVGFAFILQKLIKQFYDFPDKTIFLLTLIGISLLPFFFRYSTYIYDPGTLLIFSSAILMIAQRKIHFYYLLLILASINKETAILLPLVFFIKEVKTMDKKQLLYHMFLQCFIYFAIKIVISFIFINNPGTFVEFHLVDHNLKLFSPGSLIRRGFRKKILYFYTFSAIFYYLISKGWHKKDDFLKQGLLYTLGPLLIMALFFGYIDEFRGYYEAYPFMFLLALPTIKEKLNLSS